MRERKALKYLRHAARVFLRQHAEQSEPQDVVAAARLIDLLATRHMGDGGRLAASPSVLEMRLDSVALAVTGYHLEVRS